MGKRKYSAPREKCITGSNIKTRSQNKNKLIVNSESIEDSNKIKITNKHTSKMAEEPKLEMLLQHLPAFDGKKENNIKFYIQQFEDLATQTKLSDPLKLILLKAKFTGTAREQLINSVELSDEKDFKEFKRKILKEFESKLTFEEAQNKFMSLQQNPLESVDDFAKKFNLAASKYIQKSGHAKKDGAIEFMKTVKLTRFLEAIKPDISLEIRKSGPKTFEEALDIAKRMEIAFNANNKELINNTSITQTNDLCENLLKFSKSQSEEIESLKQELNNLKIVKHKTADKKERYCAICDMSNHDTSFCKYNVKNKNRAQNENFSRNQHQRMGNYYNRQNYA